jgi:hypothetical protein
MEAAAKSASAPEVERATDVHALYEYRRTQHVYAEYNKHALTAWGFGHYHLP